jgi:hypothetical protein
MAEASADAGAADTSAQHDVAAATPAAASKADASLQPDGEARLSPAAAAVVCRETRGPTDLPHEPGVPSMHCALSVPFCLFLVNEAARAGAISRPQQLALHAASHAWVAWVAWGRLYLGLHSPLDLAAGSAMGLLFLALWELCVDGFMAWLLSGQAAVIPTLLLASFLLMWRFPVGEQPSETYYNATCWVGSATGLFLAAAQLGPAALAAAPAGAAAWPAGSAAAGGLLAAKVVGGVACVLGAKEATQALGKAVLPWAFGMAPVRLRLALQPPVALAAQAAAAAEVAAAGSQRQGCVSIGCNARGIAWDVDTTARWCAYVAAVNVVLQWNALWQAAGLV